MKDYLFRVVEEKHALDTKLQALHEFMDSAEYAALPLSERSRLAMQEGFMRQYSMVLKDRIAFGEDNS